MFDDENEIVRLPSGVIIKLSREVYNECYCEFDEMQYFYFNNVMNSGLYFPQIMQFICVMVCICKGYTSFIDVFLCNLLSGVFFTVMWFLLRLYKIIPGINFISCFIGGNIFRYYLHLIAIAIVSLAVIGDWKIILFCLVGGIVMRPVANLLFMKLSTVKYCDKVAIFVSEAKT